MLAEFSHRGIAYNTNPCAIEPRLDTFFVLERNQTAHIPIFGDQHDVLAALAHELGALSALGACTPNHDPLAYGEELLAHRSKLVRTEHLERYLRKLRHHRDGEHVLAMYARNIGDAIRRRSGHDHRIRSFLADELLVNFGFQPHLDVRLLDHGGQVVEDMHDLFASAALDHGRQLDASAQSARLLVQGHLVPSFGERARAFHARRTAAYHHHALLLRHRLGG